MTNYRLVVYKVITWMAAMPRWNMLLFLPPKHKYHIVLPKLELPMGASAECIHWYFEDHKQTQRTIVKSWGRP